MNDTERFLHLLREIAEEPGILTQTLTRRTKGHIGKSARELITRMERAGLVTRVDPGPAGARLHLTPLGTEAVSRGEVDVGTRYSREIRRAHKRVDNDVLRVLREHDPGRIGMLRRQIEPLLTTNPSTWDLLESLRRLRASGAVHYTPYTYTIRES